MSTSFRIALTGLAFLVIFVFGFVLSRTGKPYNGLVFTIHKLVTLGLIVFLGFTIARVHQAAPLAPAQIALVVLGGLCFLAVMATGGIVSAAQTVPVFVRRLHQDLPYLTVLTTAGLFYLLLVKSALLLPG